MDLRLPPSFTLFQAAEALSLFTELRKSFGRDMPMPEVAYPEGEQRAHLVLGNDANTLHIFQTKTSAYWTLNRAPFRDRWTWVDGHEKKNIIKAGNGLYSGLIFEVREIVKPRKHPGGRRR